jgi:hypothetical protein
VGGNILGNLVSLIDLESNHQSVEKIGFCLTGLISVTWDLLSLFVCAGMVL